MISYNGKTATSGMRGKRRGVQFGAPPSHPEPVQIVEQTPAQNEAIRDREQMQLNSQRPQVSQEK